MTVHESAKADGHNLAPPFRVGDSKVGDSKAAAWGRDGHWFFAPGRWRGHPRKQGQGPAVPAKTNKPRAINPHVKTWG